ncbi:exosome non-catalytic core subunit rrp46 [Mycoemilia scoparia]|uniref:Exosome non-catalytic core subunit rrp46 n=1 Tax=Mycoemilia scoparia TaxID=417184 RepID=A0A9W7ZY32_9FUNG|nr:exosome non-catalytic core subunit rrp46 [Mycoemilia scoparia]
MTNQDTKTPNNIQRPDRRTATQIRPLSCKQGFLTQVDGSAQFAASNRSTVICGIYGPTEVKPQDEILDKAFIDVKYRPDVGIPGTKDTLSKVVLRDTFKHIIMRSLHPRTMIQLNFQVTQSDGSIEALAINAGVMALIDAGVPLKYTIAAVSCCIDVDGNALLDPTQDEMNDAVSIHTFAFSNIESDNNTPIYSNSTGKFSLEEYKMCFELCKVGANKILAFMKTCIETKISQLNQS